MIVCAMILTLNYLNPKDVMHKSSSSTDTLPSSSPERVSRNSQPALSDPNTQHKIPMPKHPESDSQALTINLQNSNDLSFNESHTAGDPDSSNDGPRPPPIFVGPTPLNTPTDLSPTYDQSQENNLRKAILKSQTNHTGAIVAPSSNFPPVPLSEDYVEEHEGGLIASAVEIINTARDLFGVIIGSPRNMSRSWYE